MSFDHVQRPIGEPVEYTVPPHPPRVRHIGEHVILREVDPTIDAAALYPLLHAPTGDPSVWDYLFEGPFSDIAAYRQHLERQAASHDPMFFTITARDGSESDSRPGTPLGVFALMSIVPEHGRIEIGNVCYSPLLQRTVAATEAILLLARHAFDELGYRRLEWKCNALNAPSRSAALRYGFVFEGIFAEHMIVKGRNRDTAWFAITDARWPAIRTAFETWLDSENFDADGRQRQSLRELTAAVGV